MMDSAIEVTKAERGFLMLANDAGELEFKVARGRAGVTLPGTSFTTSAKIPREVFTTGESRIVGDLMEGHLAGHARRHHRHRHPVRLVRAAAGIAHARRRGPAGQRPRHRRALSRRPRAEHDAVAGDAVLARGVRDAGGASPSRARGCMPSRPRRRASIATCMVAAEIQRALLPEPTHRHAVLSTWRP